MKTEVIPSGSDEAGAVLAQGSGEQPSLTVEAPRWIPVAERLPEDGMLVLTLRGPQDGDWGVEDRYAFDSRDEGVWVAHNDSFDHYMAVGGPNAVPGEVCVGPGFEAPYTHWMPLPAPPTDRPTVNAKHASEGAEPNDKGAAL